MQDLITFIKSYDHFYIFGHRDPDADCICSQLALSMFLSRNGIQSTLFAELPLRRPEIAELGKYFTDCTDDISRNNKTAAIILDCSTPKRTGKFAEIIKSLSYAVIDHHKTGELTGAAGYIDPDAPSTTLLVHRLIKKCSRFLLKRRQNSFLPDSAPTQGFSDILKRIHQMR